MFFIIILIIEEHVLPDLFEMKIEQSSFVPLCPAANLAAFVSTGNFSWHYLVNT